MQVLLVHGLSRTPASLLPLAWRLQTSGWQTHAFGYAAIFETFDQIVERLRHQLHDLSQQGPYSVVAHSLGGLLLRAALESQLLRSPAHVVMLGPPNQRPRLAPMAWQLPPFQWFTGQCGFNLTRLDFFHQLPLLRSPYTIIAGVGGPTGLLSPFGTEANDGIVAISETRMSDRDHPLEFPVEHTFMMNDTAVQSAIVTAIQNAV
ncbi:esterase/lipase family protein [Leptolyngbya iicbica]|uniref:Alpha/beta hydrolase n=2 Tax=Cyanophyceae TaxID=3028117 RepID=A0A4Q7E8R7_9CYAN|nr:hypothetical protein [Leptolyngbya sp. LK]RZM78948.1 alpha/beta hydrolase [Leptolyngbya sp. LK]